MEEPAMGGEEEVEVDVTDIVDKTEQAKEEASAAAATECDEGEASAASAANGLAATAAAQEKNEKTSTERAHGISEAAVATMTTKIEGDMLRSQSNIKDQI